MHIVIIKFRKLNIITTVSCAYSFNNVLQVANDTYKQLSQAEITIKENTRIEIEKVTYTLGMSPITLINILKQ